MIDVTIKIGFAIVVHDLGLMIDTTANVRLEASEGNKIQKVVVFCSPLQERNTVETMVTWLSNGYLKSETTI